ncbi:MAG: trehalase family glycosidase [Candidatus Saccharibacteria bacterium]|nr:trehalase family glycosidase [Candidatus Saccharibacteria bacterium]
MNEQPSLFNAAKAVLEANDQGNYTVPAPGLYPHQWLWDSCFIAIGQRHYDVQRAQTEITHLLTGQWSNGMLPNMIMSHDKHARDGNIWLSWVNPHAPDHINTSGITQPPVIAEAVYKIGQKLSLPERRTWFKTVYPALLKYHEWLHNERDPHNEGLTLQIHPWETGLDNTPPWMRELKDHQMPLWIQVVEKLRLDKVIALFRRDTKLIPAEQRLSTLEALAFFSTQRRLRRKQYDIGRILTHALFSIEDLTFNCILIRADKVLCDMAKTIKKEIPEDLRNRMKKTEDALEQLWDPYSSQYYSRNFVTHTLIKEPSIAALMPLYAGCITQERANVLVKQLENKHLYGPAYPVPSVAVNSDWFKPTGYWQGPTWVNTNWLIIEGLRQNGFKDHAEALRESTLEMVAQAGFREYFNPLNGEPAGAENFSWTAALTIDLLQNS